MAKGPWLDRVFPQEADHFRDLARNGIAVAVRAAGKEFDFSTYKKSQVYGVARDHYVLHEIATRMRRQFGADLLHAPGGRTYASCRGLVVYPWCFANSADVDPETVDFDRVSEIRRELFQTTREPTLHQAPLFDFSLREASSPAPIPQFVMGRSIDIGIENPDAEIRAVLLAYAANPRAGLLRIAAADVYLHNDGRLEWRSREDLLPVSGPEPGTHHPAVGDGDLALGLGLVDPKATS